MPKTSKRSSKRSSMRSSMRRAARMIASNRGGGWDVNSSTEEEEKSKAPKKEKVTVVKKISSSKAIKKEKIGECDHGGIHGTLWLRSRLAFQALVCSLKAADSASKQGCFCAATAHWFQTSKNPPKIRSKNS